MVEALCQALTDHSPAVQAAAAQSLSLLKSEAAGRVILPWTGHADIGVRIAAFRALRELRFPQAAPAALLPALRQALQDQAWQVREEAATTLGKVGHADAGAALVEALGDDYWQVHLRATRSLGRLRYAPALDALIETLGHRISNLRKEAALALGELNERGAIASLLAAQDDGDPEVRKAVRIALSQLQ